MLSTYILLKGVCDGRVKNRGWGVGFWAKRDPILVNKDPIWANSMQSGQKSSRIGGKNQSLHIRNQICLDISVYICSYRSI